MNTRIFTADIWEDTEFVDECICICINISHGYCFGME